MLIFIASTLIHRYMVIIYRLSSLFFIFFFLIFLCIKEYLITELCRKTTNIYFTAGSKISTTWHYSILLVFFPSYSMEFHDSQHTHTQTNTHAQRHVHTHPWQTNIHPFSQTDQLTLRKSTGDVKKTLIAQSWHNGKSVSSFPLGNALWVL